MYNNGMPRKVQILICLSLGVAAFFVSACGGSGGIRQSDQSVLHDQGDECAQPEQSIGACLTPLIPVQISLSLPKGWTAWQGGRTMPVTSQGSIVATKDRVEDGCRMRVVLRLANGESTSKPVDFRRLRQQRPDLAQQQIKPPVVLSDGRKLDHWTLGSYGIGGQKRFGEVRVSASGPRLQYKNYSWYPLWYLAADPIREDDPADQPPNNERCDWNTRQWQELTLRELIGRVKFQVGPGAVNS